MTVVFDGVVLTSYSQVQLVTGPGSLADPEEFFAGQANGLCGASVRGALLLIAGIYTGEVRITVTVTEAAPELGDWEEIVEVSLQPDGPTVSLCGWADNPTASFPLASASYRARWCASGMDQVRLQGIDGDTHTASERYALHLWPAPVTPDTVVRRTSGVAAYWHDHAYTQS